MIGTPCYGGVVTAEYANSLAGSVLFFQENKIDLRPLLLANHSLIQMARNIVLHEALKYGVDDLVWIDADIEWEPSDLLRLCVFQEDVVAGTYRKKNPNTTHFTVELIRGKEEPDSRGLIEVSRVGCGFFRMTRKAMLAVSEKEPELETNNRIVKNVFEAGLKDGQFLSEDYWFCEKLKAAGFKIMLDTKTNLTHHGTYGYTGEIQHFLWWLKQNNENKVA